MLVLPNTITDPGTTLRLMSSGRASPSIRSESAMPRGLRGEKALDLAAEGEVEGDGQGGRRLRARRLVHAGRRGLDDLQARQAGIRQLLPCAR